MKKLFKFKLLIGSALLIFIAGSMVACGDDFLTAPPQGSLDEVTLANESGVEATLIGAYRVLGGHTTGIGGEWGSASSNWTFGSVVADDAYKGSENTDQPAIEDLEFYTWSGSGAESYLNGKWRSVYEGVVRSNSTIRLLNSVLNSNPEAIADPVANSIRGEALFLRAHFHFEAWKMWGNIPYYTEEDEDVRKRNENADAVPALILADLDRAIELLPDSPRNGEVGRVHQWTAKAYKGRVQAYSGDMQGTLTTLREVRQSGPYALEESYHHVWTGFSEFENGPETILAYQASANDGQPDGANANFGERLNFPHTGGLNACCGFHQPSQNLVNSFMVDADGLPLAITDDGWNSRDENLDAEASANMPLDPRLDWTVGRHGVPYLDWGPHARNWIRDPGFGGEYSPKKNVHEDASGAASAVGWVPVQLNSVNLHLYRYADMLLLLAEAEVEVGDLENARTIVNEVRARAGVEAQGLGDDVSTIAVPIDDPSITWADYRVGLYPAGWNQQTAREAVRIERRVELAMEGHRFFDLRRWGTFQQVLNNYTEVEQNRLQKLRNASPLQDRHQWYPIPNIQIELSVVDGENRLSQNPGW